MKFLRVQIQDQKDRIAALEEELKEQKLDAAQREQEREEERAAERDRRAMEEAEKVRQVRPAQAIAALMCAQKSVFLLAVSSSHPCSTRAAYPGMHPQARAPLSLRVPQPIDTFPLFNVPPSFPRYPVPPPRLVG